MAKRQSCLLIDSHILGMKVRDFCFADAVIYALAVAMDLSEHLLETSDIQHVYDSTGSGSQLRRLIVHKYVETADCKLIFLGLLLWHISTLILRKPA